MDTFNEHNFLCHYGIKGMKWGIRRYQNPDGSLTAEGIQRYGSKIGLAKRIQGENKKAAKLERDWLVKEHATNIAFKGAAKAESKLRKAQSKNKTNEITKKEQKLMTRYAEKTISAHKLQQEAKTAKAKAEEHYNSLVNEFGKENVIKLSDSAVHKGDTIVASALAGGLSVAAISAILMSDDNEPNYYLGVRSDAKRLEKRSRKDVKGSVARIQSVQQSEPEPTYKTVSNGKSKARIESSGNAAEDKKVASNISSINKNATKRWVDDNFEYLQKRYPDKSKSELYNSLEVDTVNANGIVSLKPKTGKGLDDIGYPYVEMDRKTGKIYRGGWDD